MIESQIFSLSMRNHCFGISGLAFFHSSEIGTKEAFRERTNRTLFSKILFFFFFENVPVSVPVLLNRCHLPPYHPTKRHRLPTCFIFTFPGRAIPQKTVYNKWNNSWVVIKNETFSHFLSLDSRWGLEFNIMDSRCSEVSFPVPTHPH